MSFKVAVVVGSLRRNWFNAQLARALVKLAPTDFAFKQSEIGDLAALQSGRRRKSRERSATAKVGNQIGKWSSVCRTRV